MFLESQSSDVPARERALVPPVAFLLCHLPIRIAQWAGTQRNLVDRSLHRGLRKQGSGMALPFISGVAMGVSCPVLHCPPSRISQTGCPQRPKCPIKISQETVLLSAPLGSMFGLGEEVARNPKSFFKSKCHSKAGQSPPTSQPELRSL